MARTIESLIRDVVQLSTALLTAVIYEKRKPQRLFLTID